MEITELLAFAEKNGASDVHIVSNNAPLLRIHGDIAPLRMGKLTPDEIKHLIYSIMTEKQRATFEEDWEIDFSVQFGPHSRFRVNAFNTMEGPAAALRFIPTKIQSLDDLKTPPILRQLTYLNSGMVLVTGPTGSGKSTTLAAMVDEINRMQNKHILTIEDPVEFVHHSNESLVNQREVGKNTKSFARALKSALREDPDVILVGEMRDLETISLALTAAETGHVVFGTLHTSSAAKTVDRIIDVFPADDKDMVRTMLSGSLRAVVSQRLVKRKDETGRIAVHEILLNTPAVGNLIRDGKIPQITSIMQVGSRLGMITMKDNAQKLLDEGLINQEAYNLLIKETTADDTQPPQPKKNQEGSF
ncbi:MAG: type IV pilus twitching motility protein PilT [Alphaproteobacteria bacterium]|nr:type IV pilus twitching motility protein PilT [Alphaproteobacteria bacterium]